MARPKKEAVENGEVESGAIIAINTGLALIVFGAARVMPGEELQLTEEDLKLSGIEYHFGMGALEVKDDYERTQEIKRAIVERRKPDPDAGKSQKEVEDGGEY